MFRSICRSAWAWCLSTLEHLPWVICKTLNGSLAGLHLASEDFRSVACWWSLFLLIHTNPWVLFSCQGWLALDKTTSVSELRGHIQRRANGVQPNPMPAWNAGGEEAVSFVLEKFSGSCVLNILEAWPLEPRPSGHPPWALCQLQFPLARPFLLRVPKTAIQRLAGWPRWGHWGKERGQKSEAKNDSWPG